MKTITFAIILISIPASALELELGAYTHHLFPEDVNNDNRLVGLEWHSIEVATFANSFHDRSFALGYRFNGPGPLSVSVGAIHGYGSNSKVFPVTVGNVVAYSSFNVTVPVTDHFAVRGRVMGEVVMVSGVVGLP